METSNVATLPNGDTIEITLVNNNVLYIIRNGNGNKIGEYTNGSPATLSNTCNIAMQIKASIDPNGDFRPKNLNKKFNEVKELLQLIFENEVLARQNEEAAEQEKINRIHQDMMDSAKEKLKSKEQPLTYIGSLVDWITAGERLNIMYAFCVYAGQVILNNPVSLIPLGEAGSGKTHIQESALNLIPKECVVNEKKITEAALFNRAKSDPYFYDGKIVNYGDMGGSNDHDFMQESKNLMKELQSEGYLNKPLSVPDAEGGWIVQDLELIGHPCLTYTTVPNHVFDEQEMSRSIFITPRMDNQFIFNRMNSALEFKHGKTYTMMCKYKQELELVPYMILHLKEVLADVDIINPHVNIVINFLKQSNFYKRDFPKYNGLLKTITAINFYNHDILEIDGNKVILTSIADVQIFMSILKPYLESITSNVAPKAVDVLNDYRNNRQGWINKGDRESIGTGITTNEYYELQNLGLSKASVKKYFYELHEKGYLKVVDRTGNSNIYDLSDSDTITIQDDLRNDISELTYRNIEYELGKDIADKVKNDAYIEGLSIMNLDSEVDKPVWL